MCILNLGSPKVDKLISPQEIHIIGESSKYSYTEAGGKMARFSSSLEKLQLWARLAKEMFSEMACTEG